MRGSIVVVSIFIAALMLATNVQAQVYEGHTAISATIGGILKKDGNIDEANELTAYYTNFRDGFLDMGNDFASREHYYNPDTGRGWMGFKDAKTLANAEFAYAVNYKVDDNLPQAYYHLGRMAHLFQDIVIPQHTTDDVFNNHDQFENALVDIQPQYFAVEGGYYNFTTIDALFSFCANQSHALLVYVDSSVADNNYTYVAEIITPLSQKAVAGAVYLFNEQADVGKIEVNTAQFSNGDVGVVMFIGLIVCFILFSTQTIWRKP